MGQNWSHRVHVTGASDVLQTKVLQNNPWAKMGLMILFSAATKQFYGRSCPSVCLFVCPSLRISVTRFDYVSLNVSSWNFQEIFQLTKMMSKQQVKVKSQSQRSRGQFCPNLGLSRLQLESTDGYEMLHKAWSGIEEMPYCFLNPLDFKVTRAKKLMILTRIGRFCTATPCFNHKWLRNDIQSLKCHKKCALLFSDVIRQISRSQGPRNRRFWLKWSVYGL